VTSTLGAPARTGAGAGREPLVELRDVFCVHRTGEGDAAALQGATLALARAELVCVLGPSGAGKSTLLRVIAGLQVPSAGIVRVREEDIGRLPARARARLRHETIGFLGQHAEALLSPALRVRDAVALPLALRGVDRRARRERAGELLEACGLADRGDAYPDELSGGERQRIAVCAAVAHRPALLLADEPTGELDAASAERVRLLISELARAEGTTAVIVSHDPAAAERADRCVQLRDGRIVEDRRGRDRALVVGRGGWLHLPPELAGAAGIGERVRAELHGDGVLLRPAGGELDSEPPLPVAPAPPRARPRAADPARIELRAVSRSRGRGASRRPVIAELSAAIAPGRMTAVTGASGAGKTTLLQLLAGLDRPDAGDLLLDGERLAALTDEQLARTRRERIGYLPQEPSPVGFLSAEENVVLSLRLRGWRGGEAAERAAVVLAWVGLADRQRQRVSRLSAGETQRVALARALASARGLLVVDEPTSRLDRINASAVAGLLAAAASEDRQTVVCATHDPEVIACAHERIELGG
jgi:ABC-type lipoprotein export system ATPase subunit